MKERSYGLTYHKFGIDFFLLYLDSGMRIKATCSYAHGSYFTMSMKDVTSTTIDSYN